MQKVKTEEAVGKVLGTDVTIIEGLKKSVLFKKGHVIEEGDIPKLLSIGRHYIWVESDDTSMVHENEAGKFIMSAISGDNLTLSEPEESKVKLISTCDGIVLVNETGLFKINEVEDVVVATKRKFQFVSSNTPVAIGKVMPKEVKKEILTLVSTIANEYKPIISVRKITPHKIALFPVGNEFLEGRREEVLSFRIKEYLESLGQEVILREILPDSELSIKNAGLSAFEKRAQIVIYMGGMSIDPDDRTPDGIRLLANEVVKYGVPMFPGFTFMVAYRDDKVILGIPSGSGIAHDNTSFSTIMPIVLANYKLTKEDLIKLSYGGYLT